MATTLNDIITLVNDRRRDATSESVDMAADGFRAINGALQLWNQGHDWAWQAETTEIVYNNGIDTYALPATLNFKAIKDIRPRKADNREIDYLSAGRFDSDVNHTYKCAVKVEDQKTYLRLKYTGYSTIVNQANSVSENGTWAGASAISNVEKDEYESFSQTSSISFDYSGTSGTLTNDSFTPVNLSRYKNRSTVYFDIYLTHVTDFTSVTVKLGSSASDYVTAAITTDYLGNSLVNGWNRLSFTWDGSTTVVGTPDASVVNYLQFTIAYSSDPGTLANRIENVFISENVPITLEYYSNNMTYDSSAGVDAQVFTDATATGDPTLWSGEWDWVNESFVNSVIEIIAWMTGETQDRDIAVQRINGFVNELKTKIPSKRRYPKIHMGPDINVV